MHAHTVLCCHLPLTPPPTIAPSAKMDQAIVLSSALPPMSAKVVGKIKSGQYTPMKDLVADALSG